MSSIRRMYPDEIAETFLAKDKEIAGLRDKLGRIKTLCNDLWDADTGQVCSGVINIIEENS